ncbi:MAG: hypothetical protein E6R03_14060 [Hyphomicrobiaceae bacterium]|nr:MAG: hypothetical protein E6R03_14060 [Hyphomicrobiaceae bacterium]
MALPVRWPGRVEVGWCDVRRHNGQVFATLTLRAGERDRPIFQEVNIPQQVVDLLRTDPPAEGQMTTTFKE